MTRTPGDDTRDLCREVIWWHNELYGHTITLDQVRSKSRVAPIVACRADCMRRVRDKRGWSYPVIGRWFGGFDHSTCMHHIAKTDSATTPIRNKCKLAIAELKRQGELNRWQRILAKTKRAQAMAGTHAEEGARHENP